IDDVAEIEDEGEAERHQYIEGADDQPVGDVEEQQLRHEADRAGPPPARDRGRPERGGKRISVQAGHCSVQPVSLSGGDVLSPGTTWSTRNRSSGSSLPFDTASPTKAEVIS